MKHFIAGFIVALILMPQFAATSEYSREVTAEVTIEQKGEEIRVTKNSKAFRSICYIVEAERAANGVVPIDFAQAVTATEFPLLLTAIAKEESTYFVGARNRNSGAWGLFQVRQCVWGELSSPHSAAEQAKQAERVLRYYLDVHQGKVKPALAGYLGGEIEGSTYVDRVYTTFIKLKGGHYARS